MEKEYDVIVVGAGLFGATAARICHENGLKCVVLEKNTYIGGNCHDERREGINVHLYGPHIFHTSIPEVWRFANRFTQFNHFRYSPLAKFGDKFYNLPFNMHTFYQLYGTPTPEEAQAMIERERQGFIHEIPTNLEEKAISLVGERIYKTLIKGYTEKQWGRKCSELSPEIISRIPVRFTFDNNYFNDIYQGIPCDGYTTWISNMLDGIEVLTNMDFLKDKEFWKSRGKTIVYTGPIDEYFNYELGSLEYRSLRWEHQTYESRDMQGIAVINHTDELTPYTRTIEHKHFEFGTQPLTIISKEYPQKWVRGSMPFYPVNNQMNHKLYEQYVQMATNIEPTVYFCGRLGSYKYLDMDKTIKMAMETASSIISALRDSRESFPKKDENP